MTEVTHKKYRRVLIYGELILLIDFISRNIYTANSAHNVSVLSCLLSFVASYGRCALLVSQNCGELDFN